MGCPTDKTEVKEDVRGSRRLYCLAWFNDNISIRVTVFPSSPAFFTYSTEQGACSPCGRKSHCVIAVDVGQEE